MNNQTTKKQISSHAAAAKRIRTELRKNGIKGRVTSSCFAGGNSVSVHLEGVAPWTFKAISRFCDEHQYGHFDGMQDIYEYSNSRDDIPQVKYVSVSNDFDDEARQRAYDHLRETMQDYLGFPDNYSEAAQMRGCNDWVSSEVWQVLNGSWDRRCGEGCTLFWHKPHIKMAG